MTSVGGEQPRGAHGAGRAGGTLDVGHDLPSSSLGSRGVTGDQAVAPFMAKARPLFHGPPRLTVLSPSHFHEILLKFFIGRHPGIVEIAESIQAFW